MKLKIFAAREPPSDSLGCLETAIVLSIVHGSMILKERE